jgi:hypothetical protein
LVESCGWPYSADRSSRPPRTNYRFNLALAACACAPVASTLSSKLLCWDTNVIIDSLPPSTSYVEDMAAEVVPRGCSIHVPMEVAKEYGSGGSGCRLDNWVTAVSTGLALGSVAVTDLITPPLPTTFYPTTTIYPTITYPAIQPSALNGNARIRWCLEHLCLCSDVWRKRDVVLLTADRGMAVIGKTMGFTTLFMAEGNRPGIIAGIPYQDASRW